MKNIFYTLLLLLISTSLFAQISKGGASPSFTDINITKEISTYFLQDIDMNIINREDAESTEKGDELRYAIDIKVDLNTTNSGTWSTLSDGRKIWRLKIKANKSKALGLYYSKFNIPIGGLVFIYSEDKKQILGAFDYSTNQKREEFATELIMGDNIIIEYIAPEFKTKSPEIIISSISYAYRNVSYLKNSEEEMSSGACEINVKCPEGDNWQNQIKGVARISIKIGGSYYWCSGSLINNTNSDCTPYFLSAFHCGDGASSSDRNQWVFYFNYQSANCSGTSGPTGYTVTGATLKAQAEYTSGTYSDMLLVQLNQNIPSSFDPYYNGWSRSTTASTGGVGIHHPAGDIKKISTYTSQLTSYSSTHWKTYWAATVTNHGVTEQGSSGSPLFNTNGEIVGTLSAGVASCSNQTGYDIYGKYSYHWLSNGTTNDKRLKPWLDPAGTNPTTMNGVDATCGSTPPTADCQTLNYPLVGTLYHSFMNGNNSYGDKIKANKYTAPTGLHYITEVDVDFSYITGNPTAKLAIWEDDGGSGKPGSSYLSSTTVSASTIISDINAGNSTRFTFSTAVSVTGDFYVGIILPTAQGDTLVLTSNSDGDTNPGIAWEQWDNNFWYPYSDSNSWGKNVALAIFPSICKFPLSVNENINDANISVYPNPTKDKLIVELEKIDISNTKVELYNVYGEKININKISTSKGFLLNLGNLNNGIYFVNILSNKKIYKTKILLVK